MQDKLPSDIINRQKKGFGIPLSDWIRKDLNSKIKETLFAPDDRFNQNYIQLLMKEHEEKRQTIENLFGTFLLLSSFCSGTTYNTST
jgi:asparagine synthase (glutamine-hydrolysing)